MQRIELDLYIMINMEKIKEVIGKLYQFAMWMIMGVGFTGLALTWYWKFFTEYIWNDHSFFSWFLMIIMAIFGMSQILIGGIGSLGMGIYGIVSGKISAI